MLRLASKFFLVVIFSCAALFSTSCSSFGDSASDAELELEAQVVPTVTPTDTPVPTPTQEPTPTPEPTAETLQTELIEPISPVSPITTTRVSTMTLADGSAELIPGSEETVAAAVADLSKQTGVPAGQIALVSIESKDWSDSSLGCPQEGFMYAQVITPGYLIMLEADGQLYEYHTDLRTNVILCEQ
jgi:hypothetical protein